jgi:hypothetical protein
MPDYAEAAERAGWSNFNPQTNQRTNKWHHPDKPGKVYYNAKEIWEKELDVTFKRPSTVEAPWPPEELKQQAENNVQKGAKR